MRHAMAPAMLLHAARPCNPDPRLCLRATLHRGLGDKQPAATEVRTPSGGWSDGVIRVRRPAATVRYPRSRVTRVALIETVVPTMSAREAPRSIIHPLTAGCLLTGRSAVNERNGERGGRNAPPNDPAVREQPKIALSRRHARLSRIRKPLRILALKRATPGALWPGVSR
jgi:hypothetical protein